MTIVRVGLSETQKYAEGYEAIFGKKKVSKVKAATNTKDTTAKKKKPKKK